MISLDTNIVLRIITDDDAKQAAQALRLVEDNDCFVTLLALVETEWVLRSAYRWNPERIADALEALSMAPRISFELPQLTAWALDRFRGGADFADMLLIVASRDTEAFASFEKRLPERAGPNAPVQVKLIV